MLANIYFELSQVLHKKGDFATSLKYYNLAIEKGYPGINQDTLSLFYKNVDTGYKYITMSPGFKLGNSLLVMGELDEAIKYFKESKEKHSIVFLDVITKFYKN